MMRYFVLKHLSWKTNSIIQTAYGKSHVIYLDFFSVYLSVMIIWFIKGNTALYQTIIWLIHFQENIVHTKNQCIKQFKDPDVTVVETAIFT